MGKSKSTALAEVKDEVQGLSVDILDFITENEGAGAEDLSGDDMSIPFLKIIQSLSDERKKNKESYIEGAEEGHIFDSVSRKLMREIEVIPVHIRRSVLEWVPRDAADSGLVGEYASMAEAQKMSAPGNDLEDTFAYVVLYRDPASMDFSPAIISMSRTKMKVARRWNTTLKSLKVPTPDGGRVSPPIYATIYSMGTVEASSPKGDYYNFTTPTFQGLVESRELLEQAKELAETMKDRPLRTSREDAEEAEFEEVDTPF